MSNNLAPAALMGGSVHQNHQKGGNWSIFLRHEAWITEADAFPQSKEG
jgi:hypothetical protein